MAFRTGSLCRRRRPPILPAARCAAPVRRPPSDHGGSDALSRRRIPNPDVRPGHDSRRRAGPGPRRLHWTDDAGAAGEERRLSLHRHGAGPRRNQSCKAIALARTIIMCVAAVLMAGALPVMAADEKTEEPASLFQQENLTGDWV